MTTLQRVLISYLFQIVMKFLKKKAEEEEEEEEGA
jgi:hypothetical protein